MTNYERLHNLTIDEMAKFLNEPSSFCLPKEVCDYCEFKFKDCSSSKISCENAIRKWLESEATDND